MQVLAVSEPCSCYVVDMPGLFSRSSTYCPTKWSTEWRCSQRTSADQTPIPWVPVASPGFKPKGRLYMRRAGALALSNRASNLGSSCKTTTCSDAGTGDLGVLVMPWILVHQISLPGDQEEMLRCGKGHIKSF